MRRILACLCLLFLNAMCCTLCVAQTTGGTVLGTRFGADRDSLVPVKNARVTVHSVQIFKWPLFAKNVPGQISVGPMLASTNTDSEGAFRFIALPPGLLLIVVDAVGWPPTNLPVCVRSDDTQTLPIHLASGLGLPSLIATNQYNWNLIRQSGDDATFHAYSTGGC